MWLTLTQLKAQEVDPDCQPMFDLMIFLIFTFWSSLLAQSHLRHFPSHFLLSFHFSISLNLNKLGPECLDQSWSLISIERFSHCFVVIAHSLVTHWWEDNRWQSVQLVAPYATSDMKPLDKTIFNFPPEISPWNCHHALNFKAPVRQTDTYPLGAIIQLNPSSD